MKKGSVVASLDATLLLRKRFNAKELAWTVRVARARSDGTPTTRCRCRGCGHTAEQLAAQKLRRNLLPRSSQARNAHERIANSELRVLPNCGHSRHASTRRSSTGPLAGSSSLSRTALVPIQHGILFSYVSERLPGSLASSGFARRLHIQGRPRRRGLRRQGEEHPRPCRQLLHQIRRWSPEDSGA